MKSSILEGTSCTVPAFFIDFIGLLAINWIRCLNGSEFKYYFELYDI